MSSAPSPESLKPGIWYDAGELNPEPAYVAWLDLMGTHGWMRRSLATTANFVMKLHIACLEAPQTAHPPTVAFYPAVDGLYVVSKEKLEMFMFLTSVFRALGHYFAAEAALFERFVVRAGVAYGPVVQQVPSGGSQVLDQQASYREKILLGAPLVHAYQTERLAPPYGVAVHESVWASPNSLPPTSSPLFRWWRRCDSVGQDNALGQRVGEKVKLHLQECKANTIALEYPEESIAKHAKWSDEYFPPPTSKTHVASPRTRAPTPTSRG